MKEAHRRLRELKKRKSPCADEPEENKRQNVYSMVAEKQAVQVSKFADNFVKDVL